MPIAYVWNDFTTSVALLCVILIACGAVIALAGARLLERASTTEKFACLLTIIIVSGLSWFFTDILIMMVHDVLITNPVGWKYT